MRTLLLTVLFCLLATPSWGQTWGIPVLGTLVEDATGNFTMLEPAGGAAGKLYIACVGWRGNAAVTPPEGWSVVATPQNSGDTDATNGIASGTMWYLIRGASAPDLVGVRTGGDVLQVQIASYAGAATAPFDAGTANTLAVASATNTTATITTAQPGELVVACSSAGDNLTSSAFDAATDPTTASGATDTTTAPAYGIWKERYDVGTGTGADHGLAFADAVRDAAGATGTIQTTVSAIAQHVLIAAAFKPQWARMQASVFAQDGGSSTTFKETAFGSNVTAGSLIPVAVKWCDDSSCAGVVSSTITSCTDTLGNTYTEFRCNSGQVIKICVFDAVATSGGANTVRANFSAGTHWYAGVAVSEFKGQAASAYQDVSGVAGGPIQNPTVATDSATTVANDLVVGWLSGFATITAEGAGFTQLFRTGGNGMEFKVGGAVGTETAAWSTSASDAEFRMVVTYKPFATAAVGQIIMSRVGHD